MIKYIAVYLRLGACASTYESSSNRVWRETCEQWEVPQRNCGTTRASARGVKREAGVDGPRSTEKSLSTSEGGHIHSRENPFVLG